MRHTCLIALLICFIPTSVFSQTKLLYNPVVDVEHYMFAIELSDNNDEIKGNAAITVVFQKATGTASLDLISKKPDRKGMEVTSVKEGGISLSFEHTANILQIKLSKLANAGDRKTFEIIYKGIPADGLVFSKNKFKQRTIFADNWPNRARNWLPCVDHLSDKASVDFMVTAPAHYKVISNGILVEESFIGDNKKFTHWQETVALPTKVMVIGLADFAVNYPGNVDCIPVSSWVFPEDKKNGFYDYGQAREILPFFIKNIGPYAYKKLANVEAITVFGGMENAGAIFYNEQSITGKRGFSEELIAHEIAHQWFGNSATESDWPHVWLSEGFATEMTNLYLENKFGADTLKARLKTDRAAIIAFSKKRFKPVVDTSEKENFLALLNRNSYEKGGWVLHMLRKKLGDSLFWKGLQTYYGKYAGKNASTSNFQQVMEQVSQIDLNDFFHQWLFTAGHPVLAISWKYNKNKKIVTLEILQQQKQLFSFPLEIAFKVGVASTGIKALLIKDKTTKLGIELDTEPAAIIPDPNANLLFQFTIIKKND
ncbi:MAG: M1 family metallopeptidase [Ferruginibacter sp.]